MPDWWLFQRKQIGKGQREGFDSLVVLTCWLLWKERNARVFNKVSMRATELVEWIRQTGHQWTLAGFTIPSELI
jgi:hypothetical protein